MDKSDLIYEFTDGNLDANQEKELFKELSVNDDLRQEFKQELAMKHAIRSDAKAFTPTVNSTMNIFSSLGFTAPTAMLTATTASAVTSSSKLTGALFSKLGLSLISGILALLITGIASYFIFQNKIDELQNENSRLNNEIALLNKKDIPKVSSTDNNNIVKEQSKITKPVIKYVYITKDNGTKINSEKTEALIHKESFENEETKNKIDLSNNVKMNFGKIQLAKYHNSLESSELDQISLPINFLKDELGVELEFSKLENWHEIPPTIQPKSFNKFNNSSIRLFYNLDENFAIGTELRQETFFQKFTGVNKDNNLVQYEQQPNFTSVGLLVKYQNKQWNVLGIYPYIQLFGGGTNVGYITRTLLGLRYSPVYNLEFYLGGEYSKLFYQHQKNKFQSGRFDLNYGISVRF